MNSTRPPRDRGHVSASRTQAAADVAERRRVRRLQKAIDERDLPPVAIPRGLPFRVYVSLRWFSAAIILALVGILFLLFTRDAFYIKQILVGPTKYLSPPEIFERSGLANMHIFWVDPAVVKAKLESDASIAQADVEVGWPPNLVQITVKEREPALIWEQAGLRVWADVRGRVMALRRDDDKLVRVVVENASKVARPGRCPLMGTTEILGPGSCVDADIIAGAIQFKALYPEVKVIVYDPTKGLGYHDGRGWVLWFGNGSDILTKMAVYNTIVSSVYASGKGRQPIEINVSDPDSPYYRFSPETGQ